MVFPVAVRMCLLKFSIRLSIEEVIITLRVVKFMFESSCLYFSQLVLLNCILGRTEICIGCAVNFATMGTWLVDVSDLGERYMSWKILLLSRTT